MTIVQIHTKFRKRKNSKITLFKRLLKQEECDARIETFGESSESGKKNIDKWIPQLTTNVLFCADANLNHKTGVCNGDSGGPAIRRLYFISFAQCRVHPLVAPNKVHKGSFMKDFVTESS